MKTLVATPDREPTPTYESWTVTDGTGNWVVYWCVYGPRDCDHG